MDFVYDKLQVAADTPATPVGETEESEAVDSPNSSSSEQKQPSSIDYAADKLETGIENAYTRLSNAASKTDWGSLWATVKKQGENALKETTKDISAFRKEVGSLLSNQSVDDPLSSTTSASTTPNDLSSSQETVIKKSTSSSPDNNAPSTMLSELTKRAQLYIDTLDRDLEKIENAAGSYVGKIGKDVKSLLKDAVTVDAPGSHSNNDDESESGDDAPAEILFDVPEAVRTQIYSTRLDAQLHALHTSTQPFLTTTSEPDYEAFANEFNIDANTQAIAEDLDKYKPLRTLMESIVPEKVTYAEFWAKYYYMRKQIQDQEQRRKLLVQKASEQAGEEKDISWEDEEEEEDEGQIQEEHEDGVSKEKKPKSCPKTLAVSNSTSTRSSTDGSYDLVSKTNSAVDLSTEGKPTSTSKSIDEDEDEDDWE